MMRSNYLITRRDADGVLRKLFRVIYGSDGSYYVTSPYHPAEKAVVFKATVNYAKQTQAISLEHAIDVAGADDPDRRLKLAHHPDGFLQFSGQGILSGREADGSPKGIGVESWPLDRPVRGPAFGVTIVGVELFQQESREREGTVVFDDTDVLSVPEATHLVVEGYYFPALWRRFVFNENGRWVLRLCHPSGAVITTRVLLPPAANPHGFLGLEAYEDLGGGFGEESAAFALSSSTGNIREEGGDTLGDALYCMYPRHQAQRPRRSLDYSVTPEPGKP